MYTICTCIYIAYTCTLLYLWGPWNFVFVTGFRTPNEESKFSTARRENQEPSKGTGDGNETEHIF